MYIQLFLWTEQLVDRNLFLEQTFWALFFYPSINNLLHVVLNYFNIDKAKQVTLIKKNSRRKYKVI